MTSKNKEEKTCTYWLAGTCKNPPSNHNHKEKPASAPFLSYLYHDLKKTLNGYENIRGNFWLVAIHGARSEVKCPPEYKKSIEKIIEQVTNAREEDLQQAITTFFEPRTVDVDSYNNKDLIPEPENIAKPNLAIWKTSTEAPGLHLLNKDQKIPRIKYEYNKYPGRIPLFKKEKNVQNSMDVFTGYRFALLITEVYHQKNKEYPKFVASASIFGSIMSWFNNDHFNWKLAFGFEMLENGTIWVHSIRNDEEESTQTEENLDFAESAERYLTDPFAPSGCIFAASSISFENFSLATHFEVDAFFQKNKRDVLQIAEIKTKKEPKVNKVTKTQEPKDITQEAAFKNIENSLQFTSKDKLFKWHYTDKYKDLKDPTKLCLDSSFIEETDVRRKKLRSEHKLKELLEIVTNLFTTPECPKLVLVRVDPASKEIDPARNAIKFFTTNNANPAKTMSLIDRVENNDEAW